MMPPSLPTPTNLASRRQTSRPRKVAPQRLSPSQLRQALNAQLPSSLEIARVIELFFQSLPSMVPVDALTYQHPTHDVRLELGRHTRHSVTYQLNHEQEYLGELCLHRARRFDDSELAQIESVLASLWFPLRNALLYRSAVQSALRDPLTGAGNRIAMEQTLQREVDLARRNQQPLSVLMVDVDHFKRINDTYGHAAGDRVLKDVAQALKTQLRNVDMVYRYGGEEFLVILSNTSSEAAEQVGERLRIAICQLKCKGLDRELILSVSLGCATLVAGEDGETLVDRADQALYQAKRDGRNRLQKAC